MLTVKDFMIKKTGLDCPKQAFIKNTCKSKNSKYGSLIRAFKGVINDTSNQPLADVINSQFTASRLDTELLSFEERAEKLKMYQLVKRYETWESSQMGTLLDENFNVVVDFGPDEVDVPVDRLYDRGTYYEAITFAYKRPELKKSGRKFTTDPSKSIQLALLYLAGIKRLDQLRMRGSVLAVKPVYGAVFYLRSANDTKEFLPFDEKGDQIISHSFTPGELGEILQVYGKISVDKDTEACNPTTCNSCPCVDICKLEFVPKKKIELPPTEFKPINEIRLTPNQEKFVKFKKGECRVNAVAGSGKTTVIVVRTLNLLEMGVKPEEILMVTFTDKACAEMRERIEKYAAGSALANLELDVENINIYTFNSWGQLLLDTHFQKLGFKETPKVIDDIEKKDIIVQILEKHDRIPGLNYNEPFMDTMMAMGAVVEVGKLIDTMKAAHVETENDVLGLTKLKSDFRPNAKELLEIYKEYNSILVERNLIDYEDQLRLILQLKSFGVFQTFPYKHIIVDEFQDSNGNQIDLICQMMKDCPNVESLAVVGDEMQSIYGFRDASPDNLVNMTKHFPHMVDIALEENFRSQKPIIQMANNILAKESRLKSCIKAQRDSSQVEPVLVIKDDPKDETAFIVEQVKDWINNSGYKPSSIAILGKTRSELRVYEKALNEAGIPSIMRVPEILKDAAYVKAILAFARWMNDNSDMMSFALYAKMMGEDPFDSEAIQQSADKLKQMFANCKDDAERRGLFFQCLEPAKEDYLGEFFLSSIEDKPLHTFRQLIEYLTKYDKYGINEQHSTSKEASEAVTLITIHSSKGLEYDHCILSLKKFKETDEEKRVLYVAVTRARESMVITYPHKQGLVRLLRD